MKSSTLFLLFAFATQLCIAREYISLQGKLIAKETYTPIPYAAITHDKYGTTSKEDGSFTLKLPEESMGELYIQAIGYQDTIISVDRFSNEELLIYLNTVVYSLPTAYVSSKTSRKEHILAGKPEVAVVKDREGKAVPTFVSTGAGFSSGVLINPKKKHQGGILSKISFYAVEEGFPQAPTLIRILVPHTKLQKNRIYPYSEFRDLLKEPLVHKGEVGWNTIDMEHLNLPTPSQNFILLFTPLDYGDQYRWINKRQQNSNGLAECYGMAIGTYRDKKLADIYLALQFSQGRLSYAKVKWGTPAVAVQYVK